jgi:hypothetical protein
MVVEVSEFSVWFQVPPFFFSGLRAAWIMTWPTTFCLVVQGQRTAVGLGVAGLADLARWGAEGMV